MTSHALDVLSHGFCGRFVRALFVGVTVARRRAVSTPPQHRDRSDSDCPGPYGLLGGPWR